jgi:hypothetical protein
MQWTCYDDTWTDTNAAGDMQRGVGGWASMQCKGTDRWCRGALHFAIKTDFSAAVCLSVGLLQSDRSCKQQPASWYAAEAAAAAAVAVAAAAATATVTIALL